MPSSSTFADLFGHSPIRPLQKHMQSVIECCRHFHAFFDAVIAGDWQQAGQHYERVVNAEHRADAEKKQIRLHLHRSLFMPISRQDLLNLLAEQDKIANIARDVSGLILGRKLSVPPALSASLTAFVNEAVDAAAAAKIVIDELDELIESGFGGRAIDRVERLVGRLDHLEHETDEQQVRIRAQLYQLEAELPPVDVVFLYKVIEWIGNLADCAQTTGDRIQIIVAR